MLEVFLKNIDYLHSKDIYFDTEEGMEELINLCQSLNIYAGYGAGYHQFSIMLQKRL